MDAENANEEQRLRKSILFTLDTFAKKLNEISERCESADISWMSYEELQDYHKDLVKADGALGWFEYYVGFSEDD